MSRGTLIVVACLWAACAVFLVRLMPREPFVPWIWPLLFGCTSVALTAVIVWPHSNRAHLVATGFGLAALLLRPAALVVRWAVNHAISFEQMAFGCGIYALGAVLWFSWCGYSLNTWRLAETVRRARKQTPGVP